MNILKTAQDVRALRNNQRAAAVSGDHRAAWKLGPDVQHHMADLARQYVGQSMTIHDNPVGRLIIEIACEAALAAPDLEHQSDLKQALRSANRLGQYEQHEAFWIRELRRAKRYLPDIKLVSRRLQQARNIK